MQETTSCIRPNFLIFSSLLFDCIAKSAKYSTWHHIKCYGNYPSHCTGTVLKFGPVKSAADTIYLHTKSPILNVNAAPFSLARQISLTNSFRLDLHVSWSKYTDSQQKFPVLARRFKQWGGSHVTLLQDQSTSQLIQEGFHVPVVSVSGEYLVARHCVTGTSD
jgi:hypothetical protein